MSRHSPGLSLDSTNRVLPALNPSPATLTLLSEDHWRLQCERREQAVFTLAHEIRQPLSNVALALEIVRGAGGSAASARAVEIIQRQTRQMTRMVEDLIDAAQWLRGTMTLRMRTMDVRIAVLEAGMDAMGAAAARGHELVVAAGAEPLWVNADLERLRQVLSNLVDNAIKYTEPGGRIRLAAHEVGDSIIVRIADTGRGLDPEALTHVFDRFSQVRPDENRGLGIGLSVVREIVTLHLGRVEARSDGPGRGSEFVVTLPRLRGQRADVHVSAAVTRPDWRVAPSGARSEAFMDCSGPVTAGR